LSQRARGHASVAVLILPRSSELRRRAKLLALYRGRGDLWWALIRWAIAAQQILSSHLSS